MKTYRTMSFGLTLIFAIVGVLFLAIPDRVLALFNTLSSALGLPQSPPSGWDFYLILSAAYMYLVAVLAFSMFKHPENQTFPLLLTQAKLVSSVLSLAFFLFQAHYLVYLANFIIDAAIGIGVLGLYAKMRKTEWAYS